MPISDKRFAEFYSRLDRLYLDLPSMTISAFEQKLREIGKQFSEEARNDVWFAFESKRELTSRLLIAMIEKDTGIKRCMECFSQLKQLPYEDPVSEWLVTFQVVRYFARYNRQSMVKNHLIDLQAELKSQIEGCEQSLTQLNSALDRFSGKQTDPEQ